MRKLRVSDNHRFLQEGDQPFFYLGDTAWELFHRLAEDEADYYLKRRAEQGFNVIQAVVLAEFDGLGAPNANGDVPLANNDPTKPIEAYFRYVDKLVAAANRRGLFMGLLPTWGDKVNKKWGVGPEIFTPESARVYGEFLGRRYRDADLIWILGGDRPVESETHLAIWCAMADGITEGDGGAHLKTYHPMGYSSSSTRLHQEKWLDFNMIQSGHGAAVVDNFRLISEDYGRTPAKPVLDAEPNYEDHPVNWHPQELGYFDERQVRRAAYWSVFSGACGHTYGCHDIWQMWEPKREAIAWARTPWRQAIELPGAGQMRHLKDLLLSLPYFDRIPDQDLVKDPPKEDADHVSACRDAGGRFALVYFPTPVAINLDLSKLKGGAKSMAWFDPRTGLRLPAEEAVSHVKPPTDDDWVLVVRGEP
jgi:hypothetical protein